MKSMKMALIALLAVSAGVAPAAFATVAQATPSQGTGLICLTGGTSATCSVDRATGTATLDTSSGGFAAVYSASSTSSARVPIGDVSFSFTYNCSGTTYCETGGSPRWSIPIVTDNGGSDGYAFIDWNSCGISSAATSGTIDTSCGLYFGQDFYSSWSAFASAHPTFTIGTGGAFMVADEPFQGTISNFQFSY